MTQDEALEIALEKTKGMQGLSLIDQGPWSISRLKTLEKCPLQFFMQYVVKLQKTEPEDPDVVLKRNTGSALHRILELYYDGRTMDEAIEEAKIEWLDAVTPERWEFVESHYPNLREFARRIDEFGLRYPVAAIHPEQQLAIDRNYNRVDFNDPKAYFRGVIDLPIDMENGDTVILDHKRGGNGYTFRFHQGQLSSYYILKYFADKPFRYAQAGIHFMEIGDVILGDRISGDDVRDHLPLWLDDRIDTAIRTVETDGFFVANKGSACTYCDYKTLCRAGKRNTTGLLQGIQDQTKSLFT